MAVFKYKATYNRVRLSLFLHSYGAYIISELLKSNISQIKITKVINRLGEILNFDPTLLKKFYLDGTYARKLSKPASYTKYRTKKERVLAYLEIEKELINLINEKKERWRIS